MEIIRDYTKPIMNNQILTFGQPELVTSGTYFTRILNHNHPLYIQTPKCKTKHGFIKSNKKIYTELLFTYTDEDIVGWFERLDEYCKDYMLLKSSDWFNSSLTKEDIDTIWSSTLKLYKSGKNTLIKVNVPTENIQVLKIYDDSERIKEMDDVNENTTVQTILEICGIRFTSRSYQLNIELKQMMIINKVVHPLFNKCLIKPAYMDTLSKELDEPEEDILKISSILNRTASDTVIPKMEIIEMGNGSIKNIDDTIIQKEENYDEKIYNDNIITQPNQVQVSNNQFPQLSQQPNIDLEPIDLEQIEINNLGRNVIQEDITIKDPTVIYLEMYNDRLDKAKKLLYASKALFQEAKQIKEKYKLNISEDINGYISD